MHCRELTRADDDRAELGRLAEDASCHACGNGADLCDVHRLPGLGWCRICLEGSQVPIIEKELGVAG